MKTGEAVFLPQAPECRGNVSKVERDRFRVTWHPYAKDRPEILTERMGVDTRAASRRMRVWYSKGETGSIGFGVPA
jgi:hypothetical protein